MTMNNIIFTIVVLLSSTLIYPGRALTVYNHIRTMSQTFNFNYNQNTDSSSEEENEADNTYTDTEPKKEELKPFLVHDPTSLKQCDNIWEDSDIPNEYMFYIEQVCLFDICALKKNHEKEECVGYQRRHLNPKSEDDCEDVYNEIYYGMDNTSAYEKMKEDELACLKSIPRKHRNPRLPSDCDDAFGDPNLDEEENEGIEQKTYDLCVKKLCSVYQKKRKGSAKKELETFCYGSNA
mmetsp:Transcript_20221/g.21024  ORF Transcript_20221/g.21024 Transcript_20221/m.21024 type:complete len:236 (-) Transcript_20221:53-760(-)